MMWKKQWNKLKTALGTPEDYVAEEQEEQEQEEEGSLEEDAPEEPQHNSDPVIEIANEHFAPLVTTMEGQDALLRKIGEMTLRHEQERLRAVELNSRLNKQWSEQMNNLRSTYNVEPTVDYELNFPTEEGGAGTFVRRETSEE